jgi:hypothetical protein
MKIFNAPSAYLITPAEWTDASTHILVGQKVGDFRTTIVINSSPLKTADLEKHVDEQLLQLQTGVQRFQLLFRQPVVNAPAGPTVIVEFAWSQTQGPRLQQRQMFVQFMNNVYCLTATAPADSYSTVAQQFEVVMNTFKPKYWGADQ